MGREGDSPISHRERLCRAVEWLDRQQGGDHAMVEEACRRFDLSPADEEFLQRMWRERQRARGPGVSPTRP